MAEQMGHSKDKVIVFFFYNYDNPKDNKNYQEKKEPVLNK